MKTIPILGLLALVLAAGATAARAGSPGVAPTGTTVEIPFTSKWLDLDLDLGQRSFRLGGRLFGRDGYAGGAWLDGNVHRDGLHLGGRIEHDGHSRDFDFNADFNRRPARPPGSMDL
ncbi:MAG TPA: hypothetical protein VHT71_16730 [Methylomirabilota bacterium]|jgi:hypothetical protein|nr:hypothetical protein [Methylomirabilota bacterium]